MLDMWHSIDNYNFIDLKQIDKNQEKELEKRFSLVNQEFQYKLQNLNYNIFIIDKYNVLYIINSEYAVYIGLLYDQWIFTNNELGFTDENNINSMYCIFIEDLVYDDKLKIDIDELVKYLNIIFNYSFVQYCSANQYDSRGSCNEYLKYDLDELNSRYLTIDNSDKFYSIAKKIFPQFNLYNLLSENQDKQTISGNYDIKDIVEYYNEVLKMYESEIADYKFVKYVINDYESVYILEDFLVTYVGVKGTNALFRDKNRKNGNIIDRYSIVFQELTYNELFKSRKFSKFIKQIHIKDGTYIGSRNNNIYYRPFSIGNSEENVISSYNKHNFLFKSNFDYVNIKLPQINLKDRYDSWSGVLTNFIIFEFHYNTKIGYAIASTLDSNPRMVARNIIKKYESEAGYLGMHISGIEFDSTWNEVMSEFVEDQKKQQWSGYKIMGSQKSILAERVTYFVIPIYINNINIHQNIAEQILKKAKKDYYNNVERTEYDISEYKWKSEELMYECIKKIFNKKQVIHQYRPYYLGKLSYDVFVCGENIAFEYQGKQHFEPVDFFGGEKSFDEQQKRDKIKKELSAKNNIKLIYINYWEDITVELIKNKIHGCFNKECDF